jgi:hypothetical protein
MSVSSSVLVQEQAVLFLSPETNPLFKYKGGEKGGNVKKKHTHTGIHFFGLLPPFPSFDPLLLPLYAFCMHTSNCNAFNICIGILLKRSIPSLTDKFKVQTWLSILKWSGLS